MHTWMWVVIVLFGVVKLPIAALMLWIPFRSDAALESLAPGESAAEGSSEDDDGGSKALPGTGREDPDLHPHRFPRAPFGGRGRGPRRGPPGCTAGERDERGGRGGRAPSPTPERTRSSRRGATRVRVRQ